jgi:hypothetical protein
MAGGGDVDTRIAKTSPAKTYEDEGVQNAGANMKRRIASANSRQNEKTYWTAMMSSQAGGSAGKTTLG